MSDEKIIEYSANPDFNQWLIENYSVEVEEYEFPSSEVLYQMSQENYAEALSRYAADPKISLSRIEDKFPLPIAYYFYQVNNNYDNHHHRLDLLKSCWESIIFVLYGLVLGEARHRKLDLKSLGIKWDKYWSDKLSDRLNIIENILDYVTKKGIIFNCSSIIPLSTIDLIKKLNRERNGFEHALAKTTPQQKALYSELYPQLELVLRKLIKLEDVTVFRYHDSETPLLPRCEIFNGSSLNGKKGIIILQKDNYVEILEQFNSNSIYAIINGEAFCLLPFIHFVQEVHETNAVLCFYKHDKGGKYCFEVVSKSQDKEFAKKTLEVAKKQLRSLVV